MCISFNHLVVFKISLYASQTNIDHEGIILFDIQECKIVDAMFRFDLRGFDIQVRFISQICNIAIHVILDLTLMCFAFDF